MGQLETPIGFRTVHSFLVPILRCTSFFSFLSFFFFLEWRISLSSSLDMASGSLTEIEGKVHLFHTANLFIALLEVQLDLIDNLYHCIKIAI